jgi:2-C-methyl-D-erythritol 2,4-cyclodiphosphate synthase
LKIGHGYDAHRLAEGRKLFLGGVLIPYEKGLDGHSDADVLLHAVIDALLGAAGLGDIGGMFPDSDPAYKDADSLKLLKSAFAEIKSKGLAVGNIDATVIAQAPVLKPYIAQMRLNIAAACETACENVNVKATTEEGMGFTGAREGIAAHAVCLLTRCAGGMTPRCTGGMTREEI